MNAIFLNRKSIFLLIILLCSSSCSLFRDAKNQTPRYSLEILKLTQDRIKQFPSLTENEIKLRSQKTLNTFNGNWDSKDDVASIIKNAIAESIQANEDFIKVDLRYYKHVGLGNIIFGAVDEEDLEDFKKISKFDQQFFILFNFGKNKVTISTGKHTEHQFDDLYIIGNARNKEIIFNVSHSDFVQCNNKFVADKPVFSFIADYINHARCDIREESNITQSMLYFFKTFKTDLFKKWKMKLLSIKGSQYAYDGGAPKFTNGIIENVMNDNVQKLIMASFKAMNTHDIKYYDNMGKKFKYSQRFDVIKPEKLVNF